jgi:hypothetical protein
MTYLTDKDETNDNEKMKSTKNKKSSKRIASETETGFNDTERETTFTGADVEQVNEN